MVRKTSVMIIFLLLLQIWKKRDPFPCYSHLASAISIPWVPGRGTTKQVRQKIKFPFHQQPYTLIILFIRSTYLVSLSRSTSILIHLVRWLLCKFFFLRNSHAISHAPQKTHRRSTLHFIPDPFIFCMLQSEFVYPRCTRFGPRVPLKIPSFNA